MLRLSLASALVILNLPAWAQQAPPPDLACPAALFAVAEAAPAEAPEADDPGCTVSTPVKVSAIKVDGGTVALSGAPVLDCPFALHLARWTRDIAAPLAKGELDRTLTRIGTGTGFQCRRRNRSRTGKLSEHSFGNAIDIVSFEFEPTNGKGARFDVEPYEDMEADEAGYLDAVRRAACGNFTTILGPGSNPAHSDHLHFDRGRVFKNGKRRDNPYRICD